MTIYSIAAYEVDRAYGGPEEGGWWLAVTGTIVVILRDIREETKE